MILLNKSVVHFYSFPNGEIYFKKEHIERSIRQVNYIDWIYENNEDLIKLMFLKKYLDDSYRTSNLRIRYLPYSRMDRANENYPFTLKYICEFINNLNFFGVMIQDPHSDVSPALLNNCTAYSWVVPTAKHIIEEYDIDTVFYPDIGAQKRFDIGGSINKAYGFKNRNFEDGKITKYDVIGNIRGNVLIIDDMCSRGGTFIEAVSYMRQTQVYNMVKSVCSPLLRISLSEKKPLGYVYLLVSYLEDNVYNGDLYKYVDKIFCNNHVEVKDEYFKTIEILGDIK